MSHIYKKEGKTSQELDKLTLYIITGAIIGARLGHILFYDPLYYWQHPIEILPIRLAPEFQFTGLAGLASHGGVTGVLLALFFYCRKYKENYVWILDKLAIVGLLLGSFIRLGNLMNSEIIGTPANVPWAFIFTSVDDIPRHPSQLYEAIFYMLLFVLLFILWKTRRTKYEQGFLLGLCLITVFSQRFMVEFFKINQEPFENSLLINMGQILSIPFIIIGIIILIKSIRQRKGTQTADKSTMPA